MADIEDVYSDPNGAAYQTRESREGVPLDYVGEKLRRALEGLHYAAQAFPAFIMDGPRSETKRNLAIGSIWGSFESGLVAYLALHNMLGLSPNPSAQARRLLSFSRHDLRDWLDQVEKGGSVLG